MRKNNRLRNNLKFFAKNECKLPTYTNKFLCSSRTWFHSTEEKQHNYNWLHATLRKFVVPNIISKMRVFKIHSKSVLILIILIKYSASSQKFLSHCFKFISRPIYIWTRKWAETFYRQKCIRKFWIRFYSKWTLFLAL